MKRFLLSFFFYSMGVQDDHVFAATFGDNDSVLPLGLFFLIGSGFLLLVSIPKERLTGAAD